MAETGERKAGCRSVSGWPFAADHALQARITRRALHACKLMHCAGKDGLDTSAVQMHNSSSMQLLCRPRQLSSALWQRGLSRPPDAPIAVARPHHVIDVIVAHAAHIRALHAVLHWQASVAFAGFDGRGMRAIAYEKGAGSKARSTQPAGAATDLDTLQRTLRASSNSSSSFALRSSWYRLLAPPNSGLRCTAASCCGRIAGSAGRLADCTGDHVQGKGIKAVQFDPPNITAAHLLR